MLPSVPLVVTSSRDSSKVSDVEGEKAKCESVPKPHASVSQVITTSAKTNCPSKGSTQADRTEERDKEADNPKSKKPNTTGRSPPKFVKKKPKQIRDLEKTLNCLLSDNEQIKDEKAFAFAQSYFLKVTETLHGKDDATYSEFMRTMNDFGVTIFDATELYKKVTNIFEKYPDLSEEFLAFLLPEQAMQCGKFMEYIILTKMRSFCRKLELYYSKQPSHLRKIYSSLSTLASNNKASVDDLKNTILPLIRNNTLLVNMFLELMPTEAPHASSLTDYESMDFCNVDIQNPKYEDWFETVEIPPPAEDDMYGGEDCICPCHIPPEGTEERHSVHCMSCGTKVQCRFQTLMSFLQKMTDC
ncbi:GON-4-like protein [Gryllus bimaculatus]|nr:GON-4-like protein [Gryllus bimaculatus]